MNRLMEIIPHLSQNVYNSLENKLVKTKADNFLFALRNYRDGKEDADILQKLNINVNSFHALKSRLHDRIQDQLTLGPDPEKGSIYSNLEKIESISYNSSPSIAISFLLKLEKNLLSLEMHGELLNVYSALKKLHFNTDKYFHYSQLYNKHAAFWFSIEKANDILNEFNFLLQQFDVSKSSGISTKLQFLQQEIKNHHDLNPSRETGIILNVVEMQLYLFCHIALVSSHDPEDLLTETYAKANSSANPTISNKWIIVLDFLSFEYYCKSNRYNKADEYYEKTNSVLPQLMLHSNLALVGKFFPSKVEYLNSKHQTHALRSECISGILFDEHNFYQNVTVILHKAICFHHSGNTKKSISLLNGLLNDYCYKDACHICLEIKLTLVFFYIQTEQFDIAESIVTGIYRKIKSDEHTKYSNLLYLIKFFNLILKKGDDKKSLSKSNESLLLFIASNTGEFRVLNQIQSELKLILQNKYL